MSSIENHATGLGACSRIAAAALRRAPALVRFAAALLLAAAAAASLPPDLQPLEERFQTRLEPMDFIVVVDGTAGMDNSGYWAATRTAVGQLADALPDGTYLSVTRCDAQPGDLAPAATLSAGTRASLQATLRDRVHAQDSFRDVGASVAATLDTLSRKDAGTYQFVVFVLNGPHDPSPSSGFPLGHEPWGLVVMARNRIPARMVHVCLVRLTGSVETRLFDDVFNLDGSHKVSVFDTARPADLAPTFARIAADADEERLRMAVAREIKAGWVGAAIESPVGISPGQSVDVSFRLVSGFPHFDSAAVIDSIAAPGSSIRISNDLAGVAVRLPAGGTSDPLRLTLVNDRQAPIRWSFPERINQPLPISVSVRLNLEPADPVRSLGIEPAGLARKPTLDYVVFYYSKMPSRFVVGITAGSLLLLASFLMAGVFFRRPFPEGWVLEIITEGRITGEYPLKRFNRAMFGRGCVCVNRQGNARRSARGACLELVGRGKHAPPVARPIEEADSSEPPPLAEPVPLPPGREIRISKFQSVRLRREAR